MGKNKQNKRPPKLVKQKINIKNATHSLLQELQSQNISQKLVHNLNCDPNENYKILSETLKECRNKHFPNKLVKYNKRRHKANKWIIYIGMNIS